MPNDIENKLKGSEVGYGCHLLVSYIANKYWNIYYERQV